MTTSQQITVRACEIENIRNPEWGTFGVMEDCGDYFIVQGDSGRGIEFKNEIDRFWKLA